jgi:Tfp pilus assembly protein PilO
MQKKYQLPAIIVAVGVGYALYGFYDFATTGVVALEQTMQEKEVQLTTKTNEIKKLRHFSENIESVKLTLRELNLQLESALETLPREYDLSGFLRKISMIGFNSGIGMGAFRPSSEAKKEGAFYETMGIAFSVSGSFTQILSFFDQLLHMKRVVRVEKISMRTVAGSSEITVRNAGSSISADVTAKLYRFVE